MRFLVVLVAVGCTNQLDKAPPPVDDPTLDDGPVATARFTRLTHEQWQNSVIDIFRLAPNDAVIQGWAARFAIDPNSRFDTQVDVLRITSGLWLDYQAAAEDIAIYVMSDQARREAWFPQLPADAPGQRDTFVRTIGARLFRRPLTADEMTVYGSMFDRGLELTDWTIPEFAGARAVLQAMLQSPHFLYRTVRVALGAPLTGYERAARLSYSLWHTTPDATLIDAAEAGRLATPEGIKEQVARLVADPRARAVMRSFHHQLWHLGRVERTVKTDGLYPELSPTFGASVAEEIARFAEHIVMDAGLGVADLMTSRVAFVNGDTAPLYGLPPPSGITQVTLPADRAGLITRAGFSAYYAGGTTTNPIQRGVFINLDVICSELPEPPTSFPALPAPASGMTVREMVDANTGVGTCGEGCHSDFINPAGFALEHYDAIGRYRDLDGTAPVNAAASIKLADGRSLAFNDGVELSTLLADELQTHACYVQQLMSYLYGRSVVANDAKRVRRLAEASLAGASVVELVMMMLVDDAFLSYYEVAP